MKKRGRKKRRNRRRGQSAAVVRADATLGLGGLPLSVLRREGLLHPDTGTPPPRRERATEAERSHVDRLREDQRLGEN